MPRPAPAFLPLEAEVRAAGRGPVAGVDEAGRGPLAGPVSIGLAILQPPPAPGVPGPPRPQFNDSKLLSERAREDLYAALPAVLDFGVCVHISSRLIDARGINPAIEFAIIRAVRRAELAGRRPGALLVDGSYRLDQVRKEFPDLLIRCIVKGDRRVESIAAASILAKVARDRRMLRYERLFPGYGLDQHKGYGTARHRSAIRELGPAPIHRRSYSW